MCTAHQSDENHHRQRRHDCFGDWRQPLTDGDSVSMIDGRIDSVGVVSERSVRDSDVVIDADGATVCPGLIDSQVHWGPEICRSKPKHAAHDTACVRV